MRNNYILVLFSAVSTISCSLEQPRCGSSFGTDGNMCSERLVANLSIDDSFSYDQQNAIMRAGIDWMIRTESRVYLTWEISGDAPDIYLGDCGPGSAGTAYPGSGRICLIGADERMIQVRATHELGHFFGLGHENGIMRETMLFKEDTITQEDVAHFDRLWNVRK